MTRLKERVAKAMAQDMFLKTEPNFGSVKEACGPWQDWSQSGQDWDGGNTSPRRPHLARLGGWYDDEYLPDDLPKRNRWYLLAALVLNFVLWALVIWFVWWLISPAKAAQGAGSESAYERAVAYCYAGHLGHFSGPAKSEATEGAKRYALCVCRIAAERRMGLEQVENLSECAGR